MVEHDLHVVDVADPANPHLLGKVETGCCGWFHSVMVEGNKAYVVAWDEVSVVDVADASHPREIASHHLDDREDEPTGAALSEGRLYVACGNNGLLVFALDEDTSQATLGL